MQRKVSLSLQLLPLISQAVYFSLLQLSLLFWTLPLLSQAVYFTLLQLSLLFWTLPLLSQAVYFTLLQLSLLFWTLPHLSSSVLHSTTAVAHLFGRCHSSLKHSLYYSCRSSFGCCHSSLKHSLYYSCRSSFGTATPLSSTHSTTAVTPLLDAATTLSSTHSTTAVTPVSQLGSGPMPPKFNKSGMQSPTRAEIRSIRIGLKKSPGKLDLIVYCPLNGRCPYCKSALISINTVGKTKLCYGVPWSKSIVGANMKCSQCKKHFMMHDSSYTDSLPLEEQIKQEFVTGKGNGSHISLLRLLRSGLAVVQVQRYSEDEVRQHFHFLKSEFLDLWDKVIFYIC